MEININCDLGEKSKFHSIKTDPELLNIVNSANIACGYHAGDNETMDMVIKISKSNGVSIGAHPSFNDPENFGRKRLNLPSDEIRKLIIDQINTLSSICTELDMKVTHVKPHGALNNMACEDYDLWLRITARYPVLFITEPMILKYGGHSDQLSRRFWGMDRFRIKALEKIIAEPCLSEENRSAAIAMLQEKARVYIQGAQKRGKADEVAQYQLLMNHYQA